MKKRAIYLAGPMTGWPDFNYPAFNAAAAALRGQGHAVYNPTEFPYDGPLEDFPIREAFSEYTRFICLEACTIALLPGWEKSKGAVAEHALAVRLGLEIIHLEEKEDA